MQETQEACVRSLSWEDPLEKEMSTHCSILAWKIPWTEEPGRLEFMGSQRIRHDWATEHICTIPKVFLNSWDKPYLVTIINFEVCVEKAMAPHSSTLAWKIHGWRSLGRLQSIGLLRVGHDWATSLSLFTFMHWRRKWQPTPVFLPGESQERGSLVGGRIIVIMVSK